MTTKIYHITHLNNLPSIITRGGLIAKSRQQQLRYTDIAHERIQDRRARTLVPCANRGTLHDYVPFYFAPRSPMLYTIHRGNVEGYQQGQTLVIYLVAEAEMIAAANLSFTFTDGHAIMAYSEFYEDLQDLEQGIDWKLMNSRYWFDTEDDPDRKRRRQAEFLIYGSCPWTQIREIGVINLSIRTQVQQRLQNCRHQPPVRVYPNWYY